jgi:UDP-N-acetylglucosamine--N-acetylmuramyl-(pentapeptide) pyrophosphoryl-undecaprenol N-acetylglucosamine transferase
VSGRDELIVAGGGTGGHVLAGIAIADAWKERYGAGALFVGAEGGIEEKLVPRAGYPLERLRLGSLKRVSLARRARTFAQLPFAFVRSASILLRRRPRAVIGVGGYASGPLVLTARLIGWLWGARVAILEQNAVPGFTNRLLGRFAHRVLAAFPGVEGGFPAGKVVVTGNPVRRQLTAMAPAARDPFTVFIFGGSQGAVGMNTLVLEALPRLAGLGPRLRFIHQTGELDYGRVAEAHRKAGTGARVEKFIHDMASCYAEASLVICRAGSGTLAEVAAVGRAAILVPFPQASDNHQERNARIFSDAGAARLMPQAGSSGEDLAAAVRELLERPELVEAMERAARSFNRPDAARDVVAALTR